MIRCTVVGSAVACTARASTVSASRSAAEFGEGTMPYSFAVSVRLVLPADHQSLRQHGA